jgi:pSer/pThr/pTyr-binding forkhead associated (FHA) protein
MAAPPPVLTLVVEKGPRKGETRQCAAGSALRVGRVVKGNHLAVRDVGASQQHLAIEFLPPPAARWAVSDLGSSNGSFLNGAPLAPNVPAPLSDGDSIKIGESTVLAVSISSDSDLDAAAAAGPEPRRSSRYTAAAAEEQKPPAATRRGARKKAAVAEIPEVENEVPDAAAVVVLEEEKARPATRRGGRGKAAAAVPAEETEEGVELRPHGGRKKAEQPPELEK